jgi:syntaxin 5
MKDSKDRQEQFMFSTASAATQAPTNSLLFGQRPDPMGDGSRSQTPSSEKGKGRQRYQEGDVLALDLGSAEEGSGFANGGAFQQMQLVEQQVRFPILHATDMT